MVRFPGRKKERLLYGIFAIVSTLAFLYIRFPGDGVRVFLDNKLQHIQPGLSFAAEKIKPWPLLGLRLIDATVCAKEASKVLFKADELVANVQITALLRGEYKVDFSCSALGGRILGQLLARNRTKGPYGAQISLQNIALESKPALAELAGRHFSGDLSGSITLAGLTGFPPNGDGKADLTIADGSFELLQPVLGIQTVSFKEVEVQAALADRKVTMTVALQGREFSGTLSGSVSLAGDIGSSRLNLKGSVAPMADFLRENQEVRDALKLVRKHLRNGRYSFMVSGTVREPKFKLI